MRLLVGYFGSNGWQHFGLFVPASPEAKSDLLYFVFHLTQSDNLNFVRFFRFSLGLIHFRSFFIIIDANVCRYAQCGIRSANLSSYDKLY